MNPDEVVFNYRYVEKKPGQFVADTSCEKLPKELCGKGKLANKLLLKVTTDRCMCVGRCVEQRIINESEST